MPKSVIYWFFGVIVNPEDFILDIWIHSYAIHQNIKFESDICQVFLSTQYQILGLVMFLESWYLAQTDSSLTTPEILGREADFWKRHRFLFFSVLKMIYNGIALE